MYQGNRTELLQVPDSVFVEDAVDIDLTIEVCSVVGCIDGDGDAVARLECVTLKQLFRGGWRAADSQSHGANGANVGVRRDWYPLLLVKRSNSVLGVTL